MTPEEFLALKLIALQEHIDASVPDPDLQTYDDYMYPEKPRGLSPSTTTAPTYEDQQELKRRMESLPGDAVGSLAEILRRIK